MNNKITLAIPFYNTSKYLLECIKYSIDDDFVSEIVINDDQSSEDEWNSLNHIVSDLNNKKIKLYRNPINLGGFKNKYKTVKKASSEWVYLLDSDNSPHETTLDIIKGIADLDINVCYCPETLMIVGENMEPIKEVNFNFLYDIIGKSESRNGIRENKINFGMFLNTGNYFFNRDKYLERSLSLYTSGDNPSAADCIAFQYHWIKDGGYSKIVSGFKYFHRVRSDSYWMRCGHMSPTKASYYESLFLNI